MEVEIKVPLTEEEFERIREILRSRGVFVERKFESDVYFNHPCRDFRKTDEALRVRYDGNSLKMTYKGPKVDSDTKAREEIEVQLYEDVGKILEKLGFRTAGKVEKAREIYHFEDVTVYLDDVHNLGKFLEIEMHSDNVMVAKERIFEVLNLIGLNKDRTTRKSYLELLF